MKKILLFILSLIIIIFAVYFWFTKDQKKDEIIITNFSDCVKEQNIIQESYPRQCVSKTGEKFVEDIGNELEKSDLIRINYPRPNQEISSPLKIEGEARGSWFFEASFSITLIDQQGNVISQGIATAKTDWMTEEFVSFSSDLEFVEQVSGSLGKLLLKKDNPSGLPEYEDYLEVPVVFR